MGWADPKADSRSVVAQTSLTGTGIARKKPEWGRRINPLSKIVSATVINNNS